MKGKYINIAIAVLVAIFLCVFDFSFLNGVIRTFGGGVESKEKVIIVDAGHGGVDGGAVSSNGTSEKSINLAIAKKLQAHIETGGDVCVMVRENDDGLYSSTTVKGKKSEDMKNRKKIITSSGGDIFISIHLNFFPQQKYHGAQVFYQKGDENGEKLAKCVQDEMRAVLDPSNTRVEKESDSYYLLKNNEMPSIIVECGFLSNPEEEALLKSDSYQEKIAWAIYRGIIKFNTGA